MTELLDTYKTTRERTVSLTDPLKIEDFVVQSMADASPVKWHLAHTTWFFETFILLPRLSEYKTPNENFAVLFNSYYNEVGEQFPRHLRGTLSRPTVNQVMQWRAQVDSAMTELLSQPSQDSELAKLMQIGINHEEQHQELLITDVKNALVNNPAFDRYCDVSPSVDTPTFSWIEVDRTLGFVGHNGEGFCFDNEGPHHEVLVSRHAIANRVVSNREYLEFVESGAYTQHQWWLSDAWSWLCETEIGAPLYWEKKNGEWTEATLGGSRELDLNAPLTHISFFEADAYSRFRGARIPTEFEWELFAKPRDKSLGSFVDDSVFHPTWGEESNDVWAAFGSSWEWTSSSYRPYPNYKPPSGAIGEYNGKFMNGQYVLKGGSCATSRSHIRNSYRNFFGPDKRWQFTGIRLAQDR